MAKSIRYIIRGAKGTLRQNYNTDLIGSALAVVNITASEVTRAARDSEGSGPGGIVYQNFSYNLGAANVWVSNVSPHFNSHFQGEPGGVEFLLHVDWGSPLDVAVTITIEDELPFSVNGY